MKCECCGRAETGLFDTVNKTLTLITIGFGLWRAFKGLKETDAGKYVVRVAESGIDKVDEVFDDVKDQAIQYAQSVQEIITSQKNALDSETENG